MHRLFILFHNSRERETKSQPRQQTSPDLSFELKVIHYQM